MVGNRVRAVLVLSLLLVVAAGGCRSTAPQWQQATTATGNYVAEFPGPPTTQTQSVPGGPLLIQVTLAETGDYAFSILETPLNGATPYPLDESVDRAIEGARADREEHSGGPVSVTDAWRTTGDFEGIETREYGFRISARGEETTVNSVIFYRNDTVVQAIVVYKREADEEAVDRFLSSLASAPS